MPVSAAFGKRDSLPWVGLGNKRPLPSKTKQNKTKKNFRPTSLMNIVAKLLNKILPDWDTKRELAAPAVVAQTKGRKRLA